MLIWILELVFMIILLKFITQIGFVNSCIIMAVICMVQNVITGFSVVGILTAGLHGLILGALAYFGAWVILTIIDVLGTIGYFMVGLIVLLAILAILL